MFRRVVHPTTTAPDATGHGDADGLTGGACGCSCPSAFTTVSNSLCFSADAGEALGCPAGLEKGIIIGALEAVGCTLGAGELFDNLVHSASRSGCVAALNVSLPSDSTVNVPTSSQNRSAVSDTLSRLSFKPSPSTLVATLTILGSRCSGCSTRFT